MKSVLSLLLFCLMLGLWSCSESLAPKKTSSVFIDSNGSAIVGPKFRGEPASAFRDWIAANMKWPEEFVRDGMKFTAKVQFVVNIDGTVEVLEILNETELPKFCIKPIYDVFAKSPKWTPMYKDGERMKSNLHINISFIRAPTQPKLSGN